MEQQQTNPVQATIVSIGDTTQYQYKDKTGKDATGTKFSFEYTVSDSPDVLDGESPHWHREVLQVGNTYELSLKANQRNDGGSFPARIMQRPVLITPKAVNGARPNPPATPAKKPAPAPAPVVSEQQTPRRRPEIGIRWVQFSTHFRTAQMQATERVGQMIQLAIAGRLITEGDEPVKSLKQSTIQEWYASEITRYIKDLGVIEPADWFGNMRDSS